MTLHVKTMKAFGTLKLPTWCEPDEIYVINGGRPCKATQVWRIEGGVPCKVWPTPVATHLSTVTSTTMDGFHFMGAPHAHAGAAETYSTMVSYGGRPYGAMFIGQKYLPAGAGTVVIEARKGTGAWTEVGRQAVTGTETSGKVEVHGHWPSTPGTWQFRARFETAMPDKYENVTGPERTAPIVVEGGVTPGTPGKVTTTTRITTVTGVAARSILGTHSQNVMRTPITVSGTVSGVHVGNAGKVQVFWKLDSDTAWRRFGRPVTVSSSGAWSLRNEVFGAPGHPDLRAVFTPTDPAQYTASTSRPVLLGVFAPGPVGALHMTSHTSTSVAVSWARVPWAGGYGVEVNGPRLAKRTTGTNSGNLSTGRSATISVRAYATDHNGKRWYGPSSTSYTYVGRTGSFKKGTIQLGGGIFEAQPPNP